MDVFLDHETVADRLGDDDFRVVDVRDAWEFDGIGHLPEAVSIPFDEFRSGDGEADDATDGTDEAADGTTDTDDADDGDRTDDTADVGMLPGVAAWQDRLSTAGIETDDTVVAYDDTHGVFAARFVVTALLYGHDPDRLFVLDGDYSAWSRDRAVARETPTPTPTTYDARSPETVADTPLVDFETVQAALDDDTLLVDTREAWEYEEGHLPGAVQLDWLELVDTDGTRGLHPRERLRTILSERGIDPERRIVLYCNTARRISHTYLVLRHLSFEHVGFYEGSLTEWERRGGRVVTAE
ncbi:sulfurtransferase [Halobaculum sp. MBLA0147]|uniref:sulfurtransferase n=1 Tax=Halobaculum sp. MBLA0147 TaxID=3079934 RepID=UPI00352628E2